MELAREENAVASRLKLGGSTCDRSMLMPLTLGEVTGLATGLQFALMTSSMACDLWIRLTGVCPRR
jgi:hypothetical protein